MGPFHVKHGPIGRDEQNTVLVGSKVQANAHAGVCVEAVLKVHVSGPHDLDERWARTHSKRKEGTLGNRCSVGRTVIE